MSGFSIKVYKNWSMNAMETLIYFNIIATSVFTWYTFETNGNQKLVTNISVGVAFTQLVMVILYHAYKYQTLFQKFHGMMYKQVNEKLKMRNGKVDQPTVPDIDVPSVKSQPTYSVVDIVDLESGNTGNDGIVVDENQSATTGNNQCSNRSSGIKATEQYDSTGGSAISSSLKMKPTSHANSHQTDSSWTTSVQLMEGETIEMSQLN